MDGFGFPVVSAVGDSLLVLARFHLFERVSMELQLRTNTTDSVSSRPHLKNTLLIIKVPCFLKYWHDLAFGVYRDIRVTRR